MEGGSGSGGARGGDGGGRGKGRGKDTLLFLFQVKVYPRCLARWGTEIKIDARGAGGGGAGCFYGRPRGACREIFPVVRRLAGSFVCACNIRALSSMRRGLCLSARQETIKERDPRVFIIYFAPELGPLVLCTRYVLRQKLLSISIFSLSIFRLYPTQPALLGPSCVRVVGVSFLSFVGCGSKASTAFAHHHSGAPWGSRGRLL